MKNLLLVIILLVAFSLHCAVPEGFHSFDELIEMTRQGLAGNAGAFGKLLAGDNHFDTMVNTMISNIANDPQLKDVEADQKAETLAGIRAELMNSKQEHYDNINTAILDLGINLTILDMQNYPLKQTALKHYYSEMGISQGAYGVNSVNDVILAYTDGSSIIECFYPSLMRIEDGYVVEMAPIFKVYRLGYTVDEIAELVTKGFSEGSAGSIDTLYATSIQLNSILDNFMDNFRATEEFKALPDDQKAEIYEKMKGNRSNFQAELSDNKASSHNRFANNALQHNFYSSKEFHLDKVTPGNESTELGVKSINELKINISNEDYTIALTFGEMMQFGDKWKVVGPIGFDIQER